MAGSVASSSLHPSITEHLVETKKFYCPFLERGYCRESTRCNFSHDHRDSIKIPTNYCHFYLANQCMYGHDCKFRHSEPLPNSATSSSTNHLPINNDYLDEANPPSGSTTPVPEVSSDYQYADDYFINEEDYRDCDLCGRPCLHPYNMEQRRQHREECLREHEREMELSFAVQRSRDKVCGICMDTVVEKEPITSSRFGILEKCNHIFCLDCIRKWRGTKQFESRTIRACPECRVSSDFVVPSKYWVEDQDDKEKLISGYKAALKSKPCRYFDEGKGDCPFGNSCFYKHAYPDGRLAVLETPKPRRRAFSRRGVSTFTNYILWNILTSADDDDWSNDELESLYFDQHFAMTDDDDEDEDEDDGDYYVHDYDDEDDEYDTL